MYVGHKVRGYWQETMERFTKMSTRYLWTRISAPANMLDPSDTGIVHHFLDEKLLRGRDILAQICE